MGTDKSMVPSFDNMLLPIMQALQELNGRASVEELDQKALQLMDIPDEVKAIPHTVIGSDHRTEVGYRLAWARTYLKQFGLLSNPTRGVWQFTEAYTQGVEELDPSQIVKTVRQRRMENFREKKETLRPMEMAQAFERFVLSSLEIYAHDIGKPIEVTDVDRGPGFDAVMPQGTRKTDRRTSIEIRLSLRADRLPTLFKMIPANEQLLFIVGDTLSDERKEELYAGVSMFCQCAVLIWDYNDLVRETGCEFEFAKYLERPKKALVEDVLCNAPSQEEKERIKESRIRRLKEQYQSENVTLLLGAGVSISAGLPLWSELIHQMFVSMVYRKLGGEEDLTDAEKQAISRLAEKNQESTPLTQVRYISSALETDEFQRIMRKSLYGKAIDMEADELLKAIAVLSKPVRNHKGLRSVITYNFDDLLERKLSEKEIGYHTISHERDVPSPDVLNIYHVHGYLPQEEGNASASGTALVFSEEDYHELYRDVYSWSNLTQLNAFRETTCLFVGCSLEDPNLRRLLDIYRRSCDEPRHYAILVRKTLKGTEEIAELFPDRLQKYRETDDNIRDHYFGSIGVNVIWVDDYDEIPGVLKQISGKRE